MYEITCDWLRLTTAGVSFDLHSQIAGVARDWRWIPARGVFGYRESWRYNAAVFAGGVSGGDGGYMLDLPGSVLSELRADGWNVESAVTGWLQSGVKVRRMDIALDMMNEGVSPDQFRGVARRGLLEKAIVNGDGVAETVYVGSRSSERYVRAYDKGKQTGKGGDWTRLEFELKGGKVASVAGAIARGAHMKDVLAAMIRETFEWEFAEKIVGMLADESPFRELDLASKRETESDTERWLMERVSKTLAAQCAKDKAFAARFWEAVMQHMANMPDGGE